MSITVCLAANAIDRPPVALFELDLGQMSLGRPELAPKLPHRLKGSS